MPTSPRADLTIGNISLAKTSQLGFVIMRSFDRFSRSFRFESRESRFARARSIAPPGFPTIER
jgi:hypothetical protein